ncbi:hypothetical protein GCM10023176_25060 [Micromonospora coerulea]|uniref:Uncharacterized protein n=1 Tax=Micromonospora coerulea TaxID=47856 RepID=A0ABP8SH39_9ACTN
MVLPVAFAPALWAATLRTLRRLTRLAVTALVLVVGLGGTTADPAGMPRPVADSHQPAAVRFSPAAPAPALADRPAAEAVTRPGGTPAVLPVTAAPAVIRTSSGVVAGERATVPADGHPASAVAEPVRHVPAPRPVGTTDPAPADPGRGLVGRRGPPQV